MNRFWGIDVALDKYLQRLDAVVTKYRHMEFDQFMTLDDQPATFEDLLWFFIDPNTGRRTRILTGNFGVRGHHKAGSDAENALPSPYGDLIKVFVIEIFNIRLSAAEKVSRISSARRLISKMSGDLYNQTADSVVSCFEGTRFDRVVPFIEMCESLGLMPKISRRLRSYIRHDRDRTGHGAADNRRKKMADESVIKALGAIYSSTIVGNTSSSSSSEYRIRDAVPAFIGLLCLAAPNRAAAEVPLLTNQNLKSYSEGHKPKVYFLDWSGSKGFGDNKNHVLRSLADKIELGLNFFGRECEPGRILSRYYINPHQTLKVLLGGYPIDPARKLCLNLDEKPNLFTVGYALGFYGVEDEVFVYSELSTPETVRYNFKGWTKKRICDLQVDDYISSSGAETGRPGIYQLLNFPANVDSDSTSKGLVSIRRVEDSFIESFKKNFPTFPVGFSTGETGSVQMDCALFCLTGHQYIGQTGRKGGGRSGNGSFYNIIPPKSLADLAAIDLKPGGTLFVRHGFPSNYRLNFHQLRHYTNTIADQSGIPNEVIAAWSGRKSRNQTNEYIHTSHSDRSERVKNVQTSLSDTVQPIRMVSKNQISRELNLPASFTSTGVCTQNLITNPCEFLNDFVSSCFLCPSACYTAGDKTALEVLDRDLSFQSQRLGAIEKDARLRISEVIQKWFILHTENTSILRQLIAMMREQPKGTIISFTKQDLHFNLVDADSKANERVRCTLPDSKEVLCEFLDGNDDDHHPQPNVALRKLLTSFGVLEAD